MPQCETCSNSFVVSEAELSLYRRISPRSAGDGLSIPPPRRCPPCRERQRMAWRNERFIFVRSCSATGKRLFSAYPPNAPFPVFENAHWWRAERDESELGVALDLHRSLLEQLHELRLVTPRMSNFNYSDDRLVNSNYTNCAGDLKDCYLVFASGPAERCLYSVYLRDCFSCVDCHFCLSCTNCYEGVDLRRCNTVHYSADCSECRDSLYLVDCRGCADCIGCTGLRRKQFCIFNEQLSRDAYESAKRRLGIREGEVLSHAAREAIEARCRVLQETMPVKAMHGENNEGSTGDYLSNTKDCIACYDTANSRDCRYCTWFLDGTDSADVFAWGEMELCYQISGGGQAMYGCAFTAMSFGCKECFYVDLCVYCKHCFACVGLKNREYCILNKQYTKEEYEALLPQLVERMRFDGEWGEFFPGLHSPFGYNQSVAADHFPLDQGGVEAKGFRWEDYRSPEPEGGATVPASLLREGAAVELQGSTFTSLSSGRRYRLTSPELEFYRENLLPPPLLHPDERYLLRVRSRNPRQLWERGCDQCGAALQTSTPPASRARLLCERCYGVAVVG